MSGKLPIIFSKRYDISVLGLQKLHPFDSEKYGKIYHYLRQRLGKNAADFYAPEMVSDEDLTLVHSRAYLSSLRYSSNIAPIVGLELVAWAPNPILQNRLLNPMRYATGGTILGCELALKYGWAINLSGGYHHAKAESGGGFCFFADIPIAVYKLFKQQPDLSILIIDLDAHQGNGYQAIFKDDPRIHMLDVYNAQIYPADFEARRYIKFEYPLQPYIEDQPYLALITTETERAIAAVKPDLIIYNAGSDIFVEDPLGGFNISKAGLIQRDEIVFSLALRFEVPIVMLLSGGYSKQSAAIIGESIENLVTRVIPNGKIPD